MASTWRSRRVGGVEDVVGGGGMSDGRPEVRFHSKFGSHDELLDCPSRDCKRGCCREDDEDVRLVDGREALGVEGETSRYPPVESRDRR